MFADYFKNIVYMNANMAVVPGKRYWNRLLKKEQINRLKDIQYKIRGCGTYSLADELNLNMVNLNLFKSTILSYYFRALETSYDPENPGIFKTICTKCNLNELWHNLHVNCCCWYIMYILPPYYFNTYFTCLILGPQ